MNKECKNCIVERIRNECPQRIKTNYNSIDPYTCYHPDNEWDGLCSCEACPITEAEIAFNKCYQKEINKYE